MSTSSSSEEEKPVRPPEVISSDKPVSDPRLDVFERLPFARRIAELIARRTDPSSIVIGVNGAWGEGKTTVLNFIEAEFNNNSDVVCIRFNPWRFPEEDQLLRDFFELLAGAVDKSLSTATEKVGDWIKSKLPDIETGAGTIPIKGIGHLLSSTTVDELKKRVETILTQENKRIVILVDDIDRLDLREIQALFRLIKLSADFDHTAYVLAFDSQMVSLALQEQYGTKDIRSGRSFLEKIIQLPLNLPGISDLSLRKFAFQRVDQSLHTTNIQLTEADVQTFVRLFVDGFQIRLHTPRMANLYGNQLAFALPALAGEVNAVDHMLMEGIHVFYPPLYNAVRENPNAFLRNSSFHLAEESEKKRFQDLLNNALKEYTADEILAAKKVLVYLFPRLQGIFGNTIFPQEYDLQWAKDKRIASREYFYRFFSFAVSEDDISDQAMDSIKEALKHWPNDEAFAYIIGLIRKSPEKFLTKINLQIDGLEEESSLKLAILIACNGNLFPYDAQPFSFGGTFTRAARMVGKQLLNIKDASSRVSTSCKLLENANPLPFAFEIFRGIRADGNRTPNDITDDDRRILGAIIVKRVEQDAQGEISLLDLYPDHISYLLSVWAKWGDKNSVQTYLSKLVQADARNAVKLLIGFLPKSVTIGEGVIGFGDFDREQYNIVVSLLEAEIIYQAIEQIYGGSLVVKEYPFADNLPPEKKASMQFAWIHNKLKSEQQLISERPTKMANDENASPESQTPSDE